MRPGKLLHPVIGLLIRKRCHPLLPVGIGVAFSISLCIALWMTGGHALLFGLYPLAFLIREASSTVSEQLSDDPARTNSRSFPVTKVATIVSDTTLILPFLLVSPFTTYWIVVIIGLVWLVESTLKDRTGFSGSTCSAGPMTACGRAIVFGMLGFLICLTENLSPVFYWFQPIMCISLTVTFIRCLRIGDTRPTPAN